MIRFVTYFAVAFLPVWLITDFATQALHATIQPSSILDPRARMALEREGVAIARDVGQNGNALIWSWARRHITRHPVETIIGVITYYWRVIAVIATGCTAAVLVFGRRPIQDASPPGD